MAENGEEGLLRARIAAFCMSCAGSPEAVAECSADTPIGGQSACPAHPYRTCSDVSAPGCADLKIEDAPEPIPAVVQPVAVVQQVRLLPGLGEGCAKSGVRPADEVRPAPPSSISSVEIPPALSLPEALAGLNPERAPEALDI
jgi:hypothetical protein